LPSIFVPGRFRDGLNRICGRIGSRALGEIVSDTFEAGFGEARALSLSHQ